jgi:hypothetical protein
VSQLLDNRLIGGGSSCPWCRPATTTALPRHAVGRGTFGRDWAKKSCRGFCQSRQFAAINR